MVITVHHHGMLLRALVFLGGATLGVLDMPGVKRMPLAVLCLSVGGLLTFAFRTNAGRLCQIWQQYRRRGPRTLFNLYAQAGPWLWRIGAGLLIGLLIAAT